MIDFNNYVKKFISDLDVPGKLDLWHLKKNWVDVVGEEIAKHTEILSLSEKGDLYIYVPDRNWLLELRYSIPVINKNCNKFYKDINIKRIILTQYKGNNPNNLTPYFKSTKHFGKSKNPEDYYFHPYRSLSDYIIQEKDFN